MSDDSQSLLLDCLHTMLRPIARFCVRYSIHIQDILESAKLALIRAAQDELEKRGDPPDNISRLMATTGMHRRDVMRLTREGSTKVEPQGIVNRIIGQWQNDRRFCSRPGRPKVLTYEGPKSQFRKLLESVSREHKPGTILFELERLELVERTKKGLKLLTRVYVPRHDFKYGLFTLGRDTDDLISAVVENLFSMNETPNLHGKTEFDNISSEAEEEIRKYLLKEGTAFHSRLRQFLSQYDRDINPEAGGGGERIKVGVGAFGIVKSSE